MSPQKTTLYSYHMDQGANMAEFGGYEMPLWYPTGAKSEHLAVIEKAGIFDTSHMSVISVNGANSLPMLQYFFTKDLDGCIGPKKGPLVPGRCVYGLFLDVAGCVIDDALVYMLSANSYMVVVNAGMGGKIVEHLKGGEYTDVDILDCTATVGKMDLQGPLAGQILQKIVKDSGALFASLPYFSFKGSVAGCSSETTVETVDGMPFMVSRTGYTGEFGFEFFIERSKLVDLWEMVLQAGQDLGVIPCGLAARDSLRAGAVLPLSHQDVGGWPFVNTPWPFALPWSDEGFSKDFVGADLVGEGCDDEFTYAFAGFDPRKIQVEDETIVTSINGTVLGRVLTCTTDMAIGRVGDTIVSIATSVEQGRPEEFVPRGLSCGFILVDRSLSVGDCVMLVCGKRKIKVEVCDDIRPHRTARKAVKSMVKL